MGEQRSFGLTSPITMEGNGAAVGAGCTEVTHRVGHLQRPHPSTSRAQQWCGIHVSAMLKVNCYREERQY